MSQTSLKRQPREKAGRRRKAFRGRGNRPGVPEHLEKQLEVIIPVSV